MKKQVEKKGHVAGAVCSCGNYLFLSGDMKNHYKCVPYFQKEQYSAAVKEQRHEPIY